MRETLQQEAVRDRVERVFRFLAELARRRNPVVHHWSEHEWQILLSELPAHATVQREIPAEGSARVLLRVARATRTPCPTPPAEIAESLLPGWRDPGREARLQESPERDPRRAQAFGEWLARRAAWRETELPARRSLAVFQRLFELRGRLERESERVLLWIGDGMLRVAAGEYPLVLQRCELHFLPLVPAFELRETDDPPELATALLQELNVDGRRLAQLREQLGTFDRGVLDPRLDEFLTQAAHTLFLDCGFCASRAEAQNHARAVFRDPVVFIAPRSGALANALDGLLERLREGGEIPAPLVDIVVAEEVEGGADPAPRPVRTDFE